MFYEGEIAISNDLKDTKVDTSKFLRSNMRGWINKTQVECPYNDLHGDLFISYEMCGNDVPTIIVGRFNAWLGKTEIFKTISGGCGTVNISELARDRNMSK